MKCCVCGAESGRYPLCRACNQQKELGYIIKCPVCGQWHYGERRQRDEKVSAICADAGIPLVTFWTNYGVNRPYIEKRIREALETPPQRVPRFTKENAARQAVDWDVQAEQHNKTHKGKQGCYIATCVYGSYDCPQVWTLRRYRDIVLKSSALGRIFIAVYYAISPTLVRTFSKSVVVKKIWRSILNLMVKRLNEKGFSNNPYTD